jgi:regulatory protein
MLRQKASPANPDSVKDVRDVAVRLLARREHAQSELHKKLCERGYHEEVIFQVLEEFVNRGILSDERFTEVYVRSRFARGYGPLRIKNELKERSIATDLIQRYTSFSKDHCMNHMNAVRKKRFGLPIPEAIEERARQARFLQYRGFDLADIQHILNV